MAIRDQQLPDDMSLQDFWDLAQTVDLAIQNAERAIAEGKASERDIVIQSLDVIGKVVADLISGAKAITKQEDSQVGSKNEEKR